MHVSGQKLSCWSSKSTLEGRAVGWEQGDPRRAALPAALNSAGQTANSRGGCDSGMHVSGQKLACWSSKSTLEGRAVGWEQGDPRRAALPAALNSAGQTAHSRGGCDSAKHVSRQKFPTCSGKSTLEGHAVGCEEGGARRQHCLQRAAVLVQQHIAVVGVSVEVGERPEASNLLW